MATTSDPDTTLTSAAPGVMRFLRFALAGSEYGVSVLRIREILRLDGITRVPSTPEHVRGVIHVRGRAVPVVDLARRLGLRESPITKWTCILIVELATDDGPVTMGILADAVRNVLELPDDALSAPPELGPGNRVEYLSGIARVGREFVLLIDLDRVISAADAEVVDAVARDGGSRTSAPSRS